MGYSYKSAAILLNRRSRGSGRLNYAALPRLASHRLALALDQHHVLVGRNIGITLYGAIGPFHLN